MKSSLASLCVVLRENTHADEAFFHSKSFDAVRLAIITDTVAWLAKHKSTPYLEVQDVFRSLKPAGIPPFVEAIVATTGPKLVVTAYVEEAHFAFGKTFPNGCCSIVASVRATVRYSDQPYEEAVSTESAFNKDPELVGAIDAFIEEVKEHVQPQPTSDDLWWADENLYPIRPMMKGEDQKLKPIPSWTVVKGSTGEEVIKEAHVTDPITDMYGDLLPDDDIPSGAFVEGMQVWVGSNWQDVGRVVAITLGHGSKSYSSVKQALDDLGLNDLHHAYEREPDIGHLGLHIDDELGDVNVHLYPTSLGDWSSRQDHSSRDDAIGITIRLRVPYTRYWFRLMSEDEYARPHPVLLRMFRKEVGSAGDVLDFAIYLLSQGHEAKLNEKDREKLDKVSGWGTVMVPESLEDAIDVTSVHLEEGDDLNGWEWDPFCKALISAAQGMFG